MITYNAQDLFSSGPGAIDPGPYESRDAVADTPGTIGASVINQGTAPRRLTQRGTLVADSAEALQALIDTIQNHVGAGSATLTDEHGKDWPDCLMQRIESAAFHRLGPRYAVDYEITYLQACP